MASGRRSPGGAGGGGGRGGRSIRLFGTWVSCPQQEPPHQPGKGSERRPQEHGRELRPAGGADTPPEDLRISNNSGPWTEEEHKAFLEGLAEKGMRNWRAISSEFVKTRTTKQVMSHAQKYFLYQAKPVKRRRSLFDLNRLLKFRVVAWYECMSSPTPRPRPRHIPSPIPTPTRTPALNHESCPSSSLYRPRTIFSSISASSLSPSITCRRIPPESFSTCELRRAGEMEKTFLFWIRDAILRPMYQ
ncbi:unnamed protein product [Spirodela intermedia]|uniref:Uncharacterized protein n=1 Tax=Spirodela intermedia TaxID=51605 RepID=A0A7I8K6P9_SPIIN|nr:unnamed protein product [Spirodela intermedia]